MQTESATMTWWLAFLSLWRSILLCRKAPDPEALRALLVMLPPIDLNWIDVAKLLHWENQYGFPNREYFETEIPEDWTLGPELSTTDDDDSVINIVNSHVILDLVKENAAFYGQWSINSCIHAPAWPSNGRRHSFLSYRVTDDKGKPTELARFIAGKLAPWKEGEPLDAAEYARLGKATLANNLWQQLHDTLQSGETGDEELDDLLYDVHDECLPTGWENALAEKFWDTNVVEDLDGWGPAISTEPEHWFTFIRAVIELQSKRGRKARKKVSAASLSA